MTISECRQYFNDARLCLNECDRHVGALESEQTNDGVDNVIQPQSSDALSVMRCMFVFYSAYFNRPLSKDFRLQIVFHHLTLMLILKGQRSLLFKGSICTHESTIMPV